MKTVRQLNEEIKRYFNEAKGNYTVKAITGRDRGEDGETSEDTFKAKDDFQAMLYVLENFDLPASAEYEDYKDAIKNPNASNKQIIDEWQPIFDKYKKKDIAGTVKDLINLCFSSLDYSDYYDNIYELTGPSGTIYYDENVSGAYEDWDEEEDDEEPTPKNTKSKTFAEWFGKDLTGQLYKGNIYCEDENIISLQGAPKEVTGDFYCGGNKLTNLEGAPEKVGASFDCSENKLTSLKGGPKEVGRNFDCGDNKLTSLEGRPQKVGGDFKCSWNKLTSLEGSPEKVNGAFQCAHNKLTSLEGAPRKIGRWFDCNDNGLTSLKGAPIEVDDNFYCRNNKLTSLEGAPQKLGGEFSCDDNLIKEAKRLGYNLV